MILQHPPGHENTAGHTVLQQSLPVQIGLMAQNVHLIGECARGVRVAVIVIMKKGNGFNMMGAPVRVAPLST